MDDGVFELNNGSNPEVDDELELVLALVATGVVCFEVVGVEDFDPGTEPGVKRVRGAVGADGAPGNLYGSNGAFKESGDAGVDTDEDTVSGVVTLFGTVVDGVVTVAGVGVLVMSAAKTDANGVIRKLKRIRRPVDTFKKPTVFLDITMVVNLIII